MKIIINGCFDCFHDGHKHIIEQAILFASSNQGACVLILLNSDVSVAELKGLNRPVNCYEIREYNILNHINFLYNRDGRRNHCAIRSFNTEQELTKKIEDFKPDMIIKGDDRPDVRTIVGYGKFPICIIPRIKDNNGEDISTSKLIQETNDS